MPRENKATKLEHAERLRMVSHWIAMGWYRYEIKNKARELWNLSAPQIGNYICRAQKMLAEGTDKESEEHRKDSLSWYRDICKDESLAPLVRIRARERLDRITGAEIVRPAQQQHLHGHFWGGQENFPLPPADLMNSPDAIDAEEIGSLGNSLPSPQAMAPPGAGLGYLEQASADELAETMKIFADFDLMRTGPQYQDPDESAETAE